jgi:hypothetical protein
MRGFGPAQAHPLTSGMRSARWPHGLSGSREDLIRRAGYTEIAATIRKIKLDTGPLLAVHGRRKTL